MLDTGVQTNHPDLKGNLWENTKDPSNGRDDDGNGVIDDRFGGDLVDGKGSGDDQHGHGTHVAGIIGARGNNDRGIAGLCWSVKIVAVRVLDAEGHGTWSQEIAGIDYAIGAGAKVINASFGGPTGSEIVREAIQEAKSKGVLLVAAAGNDGVNADATPAFPAAYPDSNILSVAATNSKDKLASFSNYGAETVDLAAPGDRDRVHLLAFRLRVHVGDEHGGAVRRRGCSDAAQRAFLVEPRRHQRPPAQEGGRAEIAEGQDRLRQAPQHRQRARIATGPEATGPAGRVQPSLPTAAAAMIASRCGLYQAGVKP